MPGVFNQRLTERTNSMLLAQLAPHSNQLRLSPVVCLEMVFKMELYTQLEKLQE